MTSCIACGMPLGDSKDIGCEVVDGAVCVHCSTSDGKVRSCEEVFEGGVQFFMGAVPGADRNLSERLVRKNMNNLPYWKKHKGACLEGDEASDQEFGEAMGKL